MEAHIDYQIARARATAAHLTLGNSASLAVAADEVTRALKRLYARERLGVESPNLGLRVACDRQDLNEILANLLDNAFKHAGSQIEISAGIEKCGERMLVAPIDDDGPGLPAEARDIVLNVGERWDSQDAGSGLGLAIARDLAALMAEMLLSRQPSRRPTRQLVMANVKPA